MGALLPKSAPLLPPPPHPLGGQKLAPCKMMMLPSLTEEGRMLVRVARRTTTPFDELVTVVPAHAKVAVKFKVSAPAAVAAMMALLLDAAAAVGLQPRQVICLETKTIWPPLQVDPMMAKDASMKGTA